MYKLHAASYSMNEPEHYDKIVKLRWLLKEILGYTEAEISKMETEEYACDIVKGLTLAQALQIAQPFEDHDVLPSLWNEDTREIIWYNQVGGLQPASPKDHYCDEPMVSREHLIDPFAPKPIINPYVQPTVNIPKCPTCQSTNIQKISGLERGASVFAFGLFSKKINKSFKCNHCGYTW